jgi:hypothetical protein
MFCKELKVNLLNGKALATTIVRAMRARPDQLGTIDRCDPV